MTIYGISSAVIPLLNDATPASLAGKDSLSVERVREPIQSDAHIDVSLLKSVLDTALVKLQHDDLECRTTLDQWLAPRVHGAVRIPRRLAGDMRLWTWLVLTIGREYTWKRWLEDERPSIYRYTGDFKRNSLARLWWAAEMARNGPDYSPIEDVLRDPSTAQYALELRYSMYKPALIAFGRIARRESLGFDALKDLSKRINAYLSLRPLEILGLDPSESARDTDWWSDVPSLGELIGDAQPVGPKDGYVNEGAVVQLEEWFQGLVKERQTN